MMTWTQCQATFPPPNYVGSVQIWNAKYDPFAEKHISLDCFLLTLKKGSGGISTRLSIVQMRGLTAVKLQRCMLQDSALQNRKTCVRMTKLQTTTTPSLSLRAEFWKG